MTSDRLYYLSKDLFPPLNKLQNPRSHRGGQAQALVSFLLVDIRIAMIFISCWTVLLLLLDSSILTQFNFWGVKNCSKLKKTWKLCTSVITGCISCTLLHKFLQYIWINDFPDVKNNVERQTNRWKIISFGFTAHECRCNSVSYVTEAGIAAERVSKCKCLFMSVEQCCCSTCKRNPHEEGRILSSTLALPLDFLAFSLKTVWSLWFIQTESGRLCFLGKLTTPRVPTLGVLFIYF